MLKLLYKNLEIGLLSNIKTDMYRENGIFEIIPVAQRDSSILSKHLFDWIEIVSRLERLECELDSEDYEVNPEVNDLWERRNLLPDFEDHDCWILLDEESGKTDKISGPRFYKGGAGWHLIPTETKKDDRDISPIVGLFIGLILVAIWFYIQHGEGT